jgi:hypothetical protein
MVESYETMPLDVAEGQSSKPEITCSAEPSKKLDCMCPIDMTRFANCNRQELESERKCRH